MAKDEDTRSEAAEAAEATVEPYPNRASDNTSTGQDPPLPDEAIPDTQENVTEAAYEDDGWQAVWEPSYQQYYFYNHKTNESTWKNPRVPEAGSLSYGAPGTASAQYHQASYYQQASSQPLSIKPAAAGGYNPAIHGDYDPNADYAKDDRVHERKEETIAPNPGLIPDYTATGSFNRFTGKFQGSQYGTQNHSDEAKSHRQMNAYFDVDAAANQHDGRSLKAERRAKRFTKEEIKAFQEKRKAKKEQKRRAWLME